MLFYCLIKISNLCGHRLQARTVGSYRGRLDMPDSRRLVISNMRLEDAGTFECKVHYPGTNEVYGSTDVSIVSAFLKRLIFENNCKSLFMRLLPIIVYC